MGQRTEAVSPPTTRLARTTQLVPSKAAVGTLARHLAFDLRSVPAHGGRGASSAIERRPVVQAKLAVSRPTDPAEVEADAVAEELLQGRRVDLGSGRALDRVHRRIDPGDDGGDGTESVDGSEQDEERRIVAAKRTAGGPASLGAAAEQRLASTEGGGMPLRREDRALFEQGLGRGLESVRVHDGAAASHITSAAGAHALAWGRNIYFAPGRYAPATRDGTRLLAHEVAHVVQQGQRPQTVYRQPAPPPKKKDQDDGYKFKIKVTTKETGAAFAATTYAQAFKVSRDVARDLLKRHPGVWSDGTGDVTAEELKQKFRWVLIEASLYDEIRAELIDAATQGQDPTNKGKVKDASARAKEAADRATSFERLSRGEQKKINDETNKQFEGQAGYKPGKGVEKATGNTRDEELQRKIRDELLRIRTLLGTLPEAVRDVLGDPSKYSAAQYDQLLHIGNKLAALGPDDLALYRIIAAQSSANLDAVEKSLHQFIEFKEKYRRALEKNAAGTEPQNAADPDEVALQKELDNAWEGFDRSTFDKLGRTEKTAAAREIAYKRTAAQLKYMASHPGKTAVGMVKGLNPAEVVKGIERDIKDFKNGESRWGKWAAGTGIGSKAAGWLAGVAAVAWVVMWFIPGVNLVNAMATAMAIALYAGMAAVVLSSASQELHIQAAGAAKTQAEFETQTNAASDELTSAVFGLALLVGGFALRILGRAKFVQRYLNIGRTLNELKVKAYKAVGIDALKALRRDAIAALRRELAALEGEMKLAEGEHAALRREIDALSPPALMRRIATDARFAARLGMDPQQARAFGPAAEGPLARNGAPQAKAKILQAMDDATTEAQARVQRLKTDVDAISSDLNSAETSAKFDEALDRAIKTTSPPEQARVADEARRGYEQRAMQSAADELRAEAERIRAAGEDVVPERATQQPTNPRQPQPTVDPNAPVLGTDNLLAQGYIPDRIFMDWIPNAIPPEGWKLHVSATPANAEAVASTALPLLRRLGLNHKVVRTAADLRNMSGTQAGKFITIYPDTPAHAVAIVKALDAALSGKGFTGPTVSGEVPVGSSGLVYSRYGGFTKSTVTSPDGIEVDDVRGQAYPPWIDDVWHGGKATRRDSLEKMAPPTKGPPVVPVRPPPAQDKSKPVE